MDGITKSFSPFMLRCVISLVALSNLPASSLRTRKALLTSRLAANLQAVLLTRFRLATMANRCLTTFTISILALLSKMRLHCVTFETQVLYMAFRLSQPVLVSSVGTQYSDLCSLLNSLHDLLFCARLLA